MDVSAVVVVLFLTALALAAIVWMEVQSRKARLKGFERVNEAKEKAETKVPEEKSPLPSLRLAKAAARSGGGKE